jgi:hypothetical protein
MKTFYFENQRLGKEVPPYKFEFFKDGEAHASTDNEIALGYPSDGESLFIEAIDDGKSYSVLIVGIEDAFYLHQATLEDKSQSVKLSEEGLILSLGTALVCLSWPDFQLNWKFKPDFGPIFEFYELEDDILLRGELSIYRINMQGQVIWSFGGLDIWVNINGKREVTILEKSIKLIDFDSNEYIIDFDGKLLHGPPRKANRTLLKPWLKFWK